MIQRWKKLGARDPTISRRLTGPIGSSVLNTLDQKRSFCLAVVQRGPSELVMMIGDAQVRLGQIARSFVLRNLFSAISNGDDRKREGADGRSPDMREEIFRREQRFDQQIDDQERQSQ